MIDGVVKLFPLAKTDPPVATLYHLKVPAVAVAANVTLPEPQRDAGIVELTAGVIFAVAITAVLADVQFPVVAST